MSTIEDLSAAIDGYPAAHVNIEIVDVECQGAHINVGEDCTFRVRVHNTGILDMLNYRLHVTGSQFSTVSTTGNQDNDFALSRLSGPQNVFAHSTVTFPSGGTFFMRATNATGGGGTENEQIINAHTSSFDASLVHILSDHFHHAGAPEAHYTRHIHPD